MVQLDLFGEAVAWVPPPPKNKLKTMQELHGVTVDRKFKECVHLVCRVHGRRYYKCSLWRMTCSHATDIAINNTACGKFVPVDGI